MSKKNSVAHIHGLPESVMNIARSALTYAEACKAKDEAQFALHVAYDTFKGIPAELAGSPYALEIYEDAQYVERGSLEWDAMMLATTKEYQALKRAKAKVRRAHLKLLTLTAAHESLCESTLAA